MGGIGSNRWIGHDKKTVVEDSMPISIFQMRRQGLLRPMSWSEGVIAWQEASSGVESGSIGFVLDTQNDTPYMRLRYEINHWSYQTRSIDYSVPLEKTGCFFGGFRWWFICPLIKEGQPCNQRTAKLFLPPGGILFGCRHCYDLSYRSRQEGPVW